MADHRIPQGSTVYRSVGLLMTWSVLGALPLTHGGDSLVSYPRHSDPPAAPYAFFTAVADPDRDLSHAPEVVRSQAVLIDFDAVGELGKPGKDRVRLGLFDDVHLTATLEKKIQRGEKSYTWYGAIEGHARGRLFLVIHGDALAARILIPGAASYRIRARAGGGHVVEELDEELLGECGVRDDNIQRRPPPTQGGVAVHQDCNHDDASFTDILIVYTPAARQAAGGQSAMEAEILIAMATTDAIYEDSGLAPRLRLVHTAEVNYDENGSLAEHLSRLAAGTNGLDTAHTLRDLYGADVVTLFYNEHTDTICNGGPNAGAACTMDIECGACESGMEVGNPCASSADCPGFDGFCDLIANICVGNGDHEGEPCANDTDCAGDDRPCDGSCGFQFTGMAYQLVGNKFSHTFESDAFNVVKWNGSFYLLAHEIGHNQGAGHDRDNTQTGGLYAYSWGRRFISGSNKVCVQGGNAGSPCVDNNDCPDGACRSTAGACVNGNDDGIACTDDAGCATVCYGGDNHGLNCVDDSDCPFTIGSCVGGICDAGVNVGRACADDTGCDGSAVCSGSCAAWRTVMAYSPAKSCAMFASPTILFDGQPTGIAENNTGEADNVKTLNNSALLMANLRAHNYWVEFPYAGVENGCFGEPFHTLTEGVTAVPIGGTVHIKAGQSGETILITKKMTIESFGGSAIVGE